MSWFWLLHTMTSSANTLRYVWCQIEPIWSAPGRDKAAALPVFHTFTGADNVGRISGLGKTKWFQWCMKVERDIISALMKLTNESDITQEGRKEMFYLTTHSTHFIYSYMASDIW